MGNHGRSRIGRPPESVDLRSMRADASLEARLGRRRGDGANVLPTYCAGPASTRSGRPRRRHYTMRWSSQSAPTRPMPKFPSGQRDASFDRAWGNKRSLAKIRMAGQCGARCRRRQSGALRLGADSSNK